MKVAYSVFFLAALALHASAADITGTWKAVFTGPIGPRPHTVSEMIFELKADAGKLTGTAHMGSWPGDAPLTGGKTDGDRISFTVIGSSPWTTSSAAGQASGLPKLTFTGTIQGKEIQITLVWGNVMRYGDPPADRTLEMKATRSSN